MKIEILRGVSWGLKKDDVWNSLSRKLIVENISNISNNIVSLILLTKQTMKLEILRGVLWGLKRDGVWNS